MLNLLAQFDTPFEVAGNTLHISASIGVACYPADGKDIDTLLRNADSAMYRAKDLGRHAWQFYSADLNEQARRILRLKNDLYAAVKADQLALEYQPIVDLKTGAVVGAEALVRWHHPELGLIAPAEFIPIAEEGMLIDRVGQWVLSSACGFAHRLHEQGCTWFWISVNLSPTQFRRAGLAERVMRGIEQGGLRLPSRLKLEITESAAMDRSVDGVGVLRQLRKLGVALALDDFGTGYSSLAYLKDLEVDCLKIDKTFTDGLPDDSGDVGITRTILSIAEQLNIAVIAEGIETAEQWRLLRDWGCGAGQGYHFSVPLPADEFQALLQKERLPWADGPD